MLFRSRLGRLPNGALPGEPGMLCGAPELAVLVEIAAPAAIGMAGGPPVIAVPAVVGMLGGAPGIMIPTTIGMADGALGIVAPAAIGMAGGPPMIATPGAVGCSVLSSATPGV